MIKIGIIGSGLGRYGLLPAFQSLKDCKVVAVSARRTRYKAIPGVDRGRMRICTDWRLLIKNENLDAIALAVTRGMQG